MKKKDKKDIIAQFEKLKREMAIEKVNEVFKKNPENYREELAKLGFQWVDDDYPDEIEEENAAASENKDQEILVAYFNREIGLSDDIVEVFLKEKYRDEPNYALLRRYFRQRNEPLKALIYRGLEMNPTDIGFLNDLAFFHEFHPMLGELISRYTEACKLQKNTESFTELAEDFYYNTSPDGYEAYHALKEIFGPETQKGKILDHLIKEEEEMDGPIYF